MLFFWQPPLSRTCFPSAFRYAPENFCLTGLFGLPWFLTRLLPVSPHARSLENEDIVRDQDAGGIRQQIRSPRKPFGGFHELRDLDFVLFLVILRRDGFDKSHYLKSR